MASRCFVVFIPFGRAKSFRSEGTLSSLGRSPSSRSRPHSSAGRLPGYACNTVSSQIRVSRCDVKRNSVGCMCPRFSKFCVKACKQFMVTMGVVVKMYVIYGCVCCLVPVYCTVFSEYISRFLLMQVISVTLFLLGA